MKFKAFLVILLSFLIISGLNLAGLQATNFSADLPVLLTSAGQNDSYKDVSLFAKKFDVEIDKVKKVSSQDDFKSINTLVVVVGASRPDLSQENIDLNAEIIRTRDLLAGAESQGINIIGVYIEDKLTDEDHNLLEEVRSFSDYFIIKKPGNNTELITQIMDEKDLNYILIDKALNVGAELNKILIEPYS